jgi:hypothetical protein
LRDVDWGAVQRLQEDVREYQRAGAIGAYELRILASRARFDAMVTAEIVDAIRLAELRGLVTAKTWHTEVPVGTQRRSLRGSTR